MTGWVDQPALSGLTKDLRDRLQTAQAELDWIENADGPDLLRVACGNLRLDPNEIAPAAASLSAVELGDTPHSDLVDMFASFFPEGTSLAQDLADEVQLCRAFAEPAPILAIVEEKIEVAVKKFPRKAQDLKVGENKGDVLDPFMLAANFELLSRRSLPRTIETALSHKVLMKVEDMIGNMHQTVLGAMRGNFRVPEPGRTTGGSKSVVHPTFNPFPGADIGQVPTPSAPNALRLFQVKNKTGSAKGGDGKRLGEQLRILSETYGAETYYVAIVGNTLMGHRSKGAVLRESPKTAVMVGDAALEELTRSASGAELLLRVYRRAFRAVAAKHPYDLDEIAAEVSAEFQLIADEHEDDLVEGWLHVAMGGPRSDQDSRIS